LRKESSPFFSGARKEAKETWAAKKCEKFAASIKRSNSSAAGNKISR
jgi:hypothetical protein